MLNQVAVVNGSDPVQQQAAADANAVQDACNLGRKVPPMIGERIHDSPGFYAWQRWAAMASYAT
jgi:hypothetical protein